MNKKIAYSGVLLGLNIILILLSTIIPINTLFFMGLASLIISIVIMEYGTKMGILFYIASIILSFIVLPNKAQWIMYIFTFAGYGLVKYFIEQNRSIYIDIILKFVFANIIVGVLYYILKSVVIIPINLTTIIMFQVAFFVYDYVYSLFIEYYEEKLRKIIKL